MTKHVVVKTKKRSVKMSQPEKSSLAPKPETKAEPKEAWQPIDSAPVLTPVCIRVEGKTIEAILDGHWYVCVDGKPVVSHILYNPTDWMPLK